MRRGYQVHKALEKYGNKVVDLDKYLQWKVAMDLVTTIRGVGRVPASSNSEPPLCRELFAVRPLRRASYPPENSNKDHSAIGKDLGNVDQVRMYLKHRRFGLDRARISSFQAQKRQEKH